MQRPGEETLIRYFRGECPAEEETAVQAYLAMNIDHEYVANCLQEASGNLSDEPWYSVDRRELDLLYARLSLLQQQQAVSLKRRIRWYAGAAAVALLIAFGAVFLVPDKRPRYAVHEVTWQRVNAGAGKLKTVTLPDNSVVTLFPGSVMETPVNFNGSDRHIRLNGRAFFQVSPNPGKPFYVTVQGLTTKVLGTSFEVNAWSVNTENMVTLYTGKISIQTRGKEIALLNPDQQIRFQKTTGKYEVSETELPGRPVWMGGELDYDQATLKTILHDLEHWYEVKIKIADPSLLHRKITVSFKGLPVDRALNILSKSAGFVWSVQGDHITIKKGGL